MGTFLHVEGCIEAVRRRMKREFQGPADTGSEDILAVNQMAGMVMKTAGKKIAPGRARAGATEAIGGCLAGGPLSYLSTRRDSISA